MPYRGGDIMGCSEVWDDSELDWQAEYSIRLPTGGVVILKNLTEWGHQR